MKVRLFSVENASTFPILVSRPAPLSSKLAVGSRIIKTCRFCFCVLAVAAGAGLCFAASSTPDPIALLQGVESARAEVPPSVLHVRWVTQNSQGEKVIVFDGDRRFMYRTNVPLDKSWTMYNGSEVFQGSGNDVQIDDFGPMTAGTLADPRLLGITCSYVAFETIDMALPYRSASKVELVGREQIGSKNVWHVRIVHEPDTQRDIWIDDQNGFRVLQRDEEQKGVLYRSTKSFYEDPNYTWLPSRVETESFDGHGEAGDKSQRWILKAQGNVKIPESTWTLAGMPIPLNARVNDKRSNVFLGFWDGQTVVSERVPIAQPMRPSWFLALPLIAIFGAVPFFIYWRLQRKPMGSC